MESYIKSIRSMVGDTFIMLNATSVVIVNEKNQVLLQKRSDNHLWGLPGGLLELDESIEEAAIREVKEETNLDVRLTKFIGVFINPCMTWRVTDKAKVFAFSFAAEVLSGELRVNDEESLEFRYFDYDDLPQIHAQDNIDSIQAYFQNKFHLVEGKSYE
ncbi:MAG: NUDIX domain-containing protein [Firmicutes bacterium]|nr:NUDIX domain-containing protein [Bacillota bacterium]